MPDIQKSYIGVGKVLARAYGSTGRYRHVGNVSELLVKHNLDVKKQRDYTRPGGGTAAKIERIESVECSINMLSWSKENWALAVAGTVADVAGATITDEEITGYLETTVPLAFPPATITTVTNVGGTITYVAGTDYERTASGLYFPEGSTIVDAAGLEVTYTSAAHSRIEAAMQTSSELELLFEGLNEAESNAGAVVNLWRVSVPSAEQLSLIGEDFGEFKFTAESLADATKGSGVSAFYRARVVGLSA